MENKDISKLIESERNINLKLIEQDKRERKQFGDKNYLDVALEAIKKFNSEFNGTFDGPQEYEIEENLTIEEIKLKYNLQDDIVALNLQRLRTTIKNERQKSLNYSELLEFIKSAMNYGNMQLWLITQQIDGIKLTLNDELKKFFELNSTDDILLLYDIEQNYNQSNLDGIKKILERK